MTFEIAVVLAFVAGSIILFATEKLPVDLVSIIVMIGLVISRIITPEEGIAGFSHPATVTVASMFILSAGLYRTGAVNFIGAQLVQAGKKNFWFALVLLMVITSTFSAFINVTAVVVLLLPVVLNLARELNVSPGKLLMPLSFSALFGGVCTLIGTSTNILVSSIAVDYGQPQFRMFEFTPFGIIILVAGTLYMIFIGVRLIPERKVEVDLRKQFGIGDYLVEIVLEQEARSVGTVLADSPLLRDIAIISVDVYRDGKRLEESPDRIILQNKDHLKVRCNLENFHKLHEREGIILRHELNEKTKGEDTILIEAAISSGGTLDGRSLKQTRFRSSYGLTALAVRHRGVVMLENLEEMPLRAGDVLLFEMEKSQLDQLREDNTFVLITEVEFTTFRKRQMAFAVSIIAFVVGSAASGLLPILVSAIIGCVCMVLSRCLTIEEAYGSIQWKIIFLLGGVLALGKAIRKAVPLFLLLIHWWILSAAWVHGQSCLPSIF